MVIDRVGGIGPNYGPKKSEGPKKTESSAKLSDNVSISEEAAKRVELERTARLAKNAPVEEGRTEKLRDIKQKLANGAYDNLSDEVLAGVADKIMADKIAPAFFKKS